MLQILSSLGLCTMLLLRHSRPHTQLQSMLGSLGKWRIHQSCAGGRPLRGRQWGRRRKHLGWRIPTNPLRLARIYGFMCTPNDFRGKVYWFYFSYYGELMNQLECLWICSLLDNNARCYEIDWKSRVIAVADDYVVLDKPAATSVCFSFRSFSYLLVLMVSCALLL